MYTKHFILLTIYLFLIVLFSVNAFADAVPGPKKGCPVGSFGDVNHREQYCAPSPVCKADGDCRQDQVCREVSLCVYEDSISDRRDRHPDGNPRSYPYWVVSGICSGNKTCGNRQCQTLKRCIPKDKANTLPDAGGATEKQTGGVSSACGCQVIGKGSVGGFFLLFLGMVGLLFSMRRRAS